MVERWKMKDETRRQNLEERECYHLISPFHRACVWYILGQSSTQHIRKMPAIVDASRTILRHPIISPVAGNRFHPNNVEHTCSQIQLVCAVNRICRRYGTWYNPNDRALPGCHVVGGGIWRARETVLMLTTTIMWEQQRDKHVRITSHLLAMMLTQLLSGLWSKQKRAISTFARVIKSEIV